MHKYYCLVLALLMPHAASTQGLGLGVGLDAAPLTAKAAGGGASCSQSSAFFARAGSLDTTHHNAYDALICGLVQDTTWATLDVLYIFATATTTVANLNLVSSSFPITAVGAPAFTVDAGYTGVDASTTIYLDTGYNFSTSAVHYQLNDALISEHSLAGTVSSSSGGTVIGAYDGTNLTQVAPDYPGPLAFININETSASSSDATSLGATGQYIGVRSAGGPQSYYNGVVITGGVTGTLGAVVNLSAYILARHNTGGAGSGSANQVAEVSIGGSLAAANVANLYNRVCTYIKAVHGGSC